MTSVLFFYFFKLLGSFCYLIKLINSICYWSNNLIYSEGKVKCCNTRKYVSKLVWRYDCSFVSFIFEFWNKLKKWRELQKLNLISILMKMCGEKTMVNIFLKDPLTLLDYRFFKRCIFLVKQLNKYNTKLTFETK